ncbi:FecR family protein [Patescibacteria group bacterium]|nr:FecR family protein [Patescibacteria group bacterium]
MYQSNKRMPRKRMRDYFMPFFIIVLILAIVVFGWRTLNKVLIDENRNTSGEKIFLNIENGSAKAMTVGKGEWKNVPDSIYLYSGEKLKTGTDGRASLTFSDQSIVRLDTNTEIELVQLEKKHEAYITEVALEDGQIWAKIENISNPDSSFTVSTDLLVIDSRGGDFAVTDPGTVYVMEGNTQVSIKYDDEIIKTVNVGVGQQFSIDGEGVSQLNEGLETDLIFALSDTFKSSSWYRWNIKKDGAISAFEEGSDEGDNVDLQDPASPEETDEDLDETIVPGRLVSITKPSQNTETNQSSITLEGLFDADKVEAVYIGGKKATITGNNKWKISSFALTQEGENSLTVEAEDSLGQRTSLDPFVITYDTTPPEAPVIEEPTPDEGEDSVTIDDVEQIIKGSVSTDTYAVIVNDYRLSKYVPGSEKFEYYAKVAYGNLEVGENEYIAYAEDKAGNQSEPAELILVLEQETVDEAGVEVGEEVADDETETETETDTTPEATSAGGVTITSPNNGESFTTSETEFEIAGEVPADTAKVFVNDYQLQAFQTGDTTYRYNASSSMGNLEIGEQNTFDVEAYDEDDNLLGSASITIDIQSGSAAAPTITMPSTTGSYSTTLNEIVIGGTVGKWVQKVYINDVELDTYTPGSEEWRKTITLEPGDNVFTIYGQQDGENTESASITVTY